MTTWCHSVSSRRSPVALSRQLSEVAREKLAMRAPAWVRAILGSLPRWPTRMTLLTPAMAQASAVLVEVGSMAERMRCNPAMTATAWARQSCSG